MSSLVIKSASDDSHNMTPSTHVYWVSEECARSAGH